jgi:hypothetical protein
MRSTHVPRFRKVKHVCRSISTSAFIKQYQYAADPKHHITECWGGSSRKSKYSNVSHTHGYVEQSWECLFTDQPPNSDRRKSFTQPSTKRRRFFELCVNTGGYTITLGEIDVTDVQSDQELFFKIVEKHYNLRTPRFRRMLMKPVDVHFVFVSSPAALILRFLTFTSSA